MMLTEKITTALHYLLLTIAVGMMFFLYGCATWTGEKGVENNWRNPDLPTWEIGKTTDMDVAKTPAVKKVKTHYYEILDRFGPPAQIPALSEGFAFLYESLLINEQQIGISMPGEVFSWFKLSVADTDVERQIQIFIFDKSGFLRSYADRAVRDDVGDGLSFQFFAAVEQIIDTRYLEMDPVQQGWGFGLLNSLPQTLNSRQSLDFGTRGLEQRGTPTIVGQRTLEMH